MIRRLGEFEVAVGGTRHARAIAKLFARVQNERTLHLTIWSSDRAEHFVADVIEDKNPQEGMRFYVATKGDELHAAFCIRETEARMFFDNIFVTPLFRERQMTIAFIFECCEHYRQTTLDPEECAWDVWSHERLLVAWYRRLGGREILRKNWLKIQPPAIAHQLPISIVGLEESDRQQDRYGFSMLNFITASDVLSVGRLGRHGYRLTNRRAIQNQAFLSFLAACDPKRILYVSLLADDPLRLGEPIATSVRMHAELHTFLRQLAKQIPQVIMA